MKIFLAVMVIFCLLLGAGAAIIWAGVYDVAADNPHWSITRRMIEKLRDGSIFVRSKEIIVPSGRDPDLIQSGFQHYHAMCRLCHNAPGYLRTEISRGLYPPPPDFTVPDAKLPPDAKAFWIVKHGIKMTGMPSFGTTHSEEELWGIVLFLKNIPNLNPDKYRKMATFPLNREERHHH